MPPGVVSQELGGLLLFHASAVASSLFLGLQQHASLFMT